MNEQTNKYDRQTAWKHNTFTDMLGGSVIYVVDIFSVSVSVKLSVYILFCSIIIIKIKFYLLTKWMNPFNQNHTVSWQRHNDQNTINCVQSNSTEVKGACYILHFVTQERIKPVWNFLRFSQVVLHACSLSSLQALHTVGRTTGIASGLCKKPAPLISHAVFHETQPNLKNSRKEQEAHSMDSANKRFCESLYCLLHTPAVLDQDTAE